MITGRDGSKHTGFEEKAAVTRDFGHSGSQKLTRRGFAALSAVMALSLLRSPLIACRKATAQMLRDIDTKDHGITLFLCGDVMTGRGIDEVLAYPSDPRICEPFVSSALEYVDLAEHADGPIPRPVDFAYSWGDGLPCIWTMRQYSGRAHAGALTHVKGICRSDGLWLDYDASSASFVGE